MDASAAHDRKDWLIGVAALFHLRMNFLWLMERTHYKTMEQQDASTLDHNNSFWGRKNIPADRSAFQVLEELVPHSFVARVVGNFPLMNSFGMFRFLLLCQHYHPIKLWVSSFEHLNQHARLGDTQLQLRVPSKMCVLFEDIQPEKRHALHRSEARVLSTGELAEQLPTSYLPP